MKYTILCIFALAFTAQAVMTDSEAMASIQKLESTQYGRTILDTIALQLEAQDSADDLVLMLRETEEKMFKEQQKDDQAQMDLQNQCYDDLNRLKAEIKAAEKRVKEIDEELDEKIPIRDNKMAERADLESFKAMLEDRLRKMLVQKNIREEQWNKQKEEHDKAAAVIQNAKQLMEQIFRGSFLQKNQNTAVFAQMQSHFQEAKKYHYEKKSWNSIFQAMATISSTLGPQADHEVVQKVFDLMDRLLDEISKSREVERRSFEQWMQEYERTRGGIQKRLDETNGAISQLTIEINTLTKRINMLKDEKAEQLERIEEKTKEREERKIFCDDEANAYSQRRQARNDEAEVVSDAIALLTSKLRTLKKYTSAKVDKLQKPE